jgi:hypothetical protein
MGVAETSPYVPRRDGEGAYNTSRKARPNHLERAQAQGLDARLHLLGAPNAEDARYVHVAPPRPAGISPMPAETNTPHAGRSCVKNLAGAPTLLQGFGGYSRGSASAAARNRTSDQGEERPISKRQHLRDPNEYAHRCSGATVGDNHEGPLNNQGKPAYIRKKTNANEPKNMRKTNPRAHGPPNNRPSHPRAELRFARGVQRRTGTTPPRSRAVGASCRNGCADGDLSTLDGDRDHRVVA